MTDSFTEGQKINGYAVKRICPLPSIDSTLIDLVHEVTKAKHIHIANKDKENTFGVFFRTVPTDSSGVAHILEHTVLCGSKKFGVRDPFFSMIKRSLNTFMNAFTASDWTMYPFATQNKKDYYNLMEVYLDAAFFPTIDLLSFKQEGHRLELVDPESQESALEYKGVVYNEMKGAMSSPDQVLSRALLASLYPDTTYRNNSGGEPSDIPKLTHEALREFHGRYYHPSNAYFYTYGSFPLEENLTFISEQVLNQFDYLAVNSAVPAQTRWTSPRNQIQAYAYSDPQELSTKYQACVAWLTCDIKESFEILVLTVLEQILLGNSASPLRKALIDSNLGSALSDATGFEADNRDTMFVCGLKDIAKESVPRVEEIIFTTLKQLKEKGIDKHLIESAIHQIEFYRKEITNTPYPFGIKLLLSFAGTLIHDGDPVSCINIDEDLETLARKISQGNFLEQEIDRYFLENPHRVLFTLEPDIGLEEKTAAETRQELQEILASLKAEDIHQINSDAQALEARQETEDDLTILPTLELSDVLPDIEIIRPDKVQGIGFSTCYDKATSGILYFTCPVGAGNIPPDLFPLVPFFSKAFTNSGTQKSSYVEMAKAVDLYTGGVAMSPFSGSYFSREGGAHSFLALQGKSLDRNIDKMFDIMDELVIHYGFGDQERLKNLLLQYQAAMESSIVSTGHKFAISLSARHLSQASHINELWHGIDQFQTLRGITSRLADPRTRKKAMETLVSSLEAIAISLFKKDNLKPALIGSALSIKRGDLRVGLINNALTDGTPPAFLTPDISRTLQRPYEGWYTNTAVSFVGQSFKAVPITHDDSPGLAVISKILRSLYLHREIREKGGAYGGFALYNTEEGIFSFGSYRDPHIKRTLDVYKNGCNFITQGDYTQTDVKEAILQVCSDIDKPETPGPASMKAFYRDITKLSDEIRRHFKDCLLSLDKRQIQEIAATYFTIEEDQKGVSVISSKSLLEAANQALEADNREPLRLRKI